jgi:hypothetical protein
MPTGSTLTAEGRRSISLVGKGILQDGRHLRGLGVGLRGHETDRPAWRRAVLAVALLLVVEAQRQPGPGAWPWLGQLPAVGPGHVRHPATRCRLRGGLRHRRIAASRAWIGDDDR